jgi:D-glycero-D-manno-heptose 1,7-bisphosphate phosphatase
MLTRLAAKYEIDLKASYMIGDRNVDIDAGKNAGCKTIKIGKAYNKADYIANNLLDAVKIILDLQ